LHGSGASAPQVSGFCRWARVFEYWRNVDPDLGKKVGEGVRATLNGNRA
jgi:hypothetical protein